MYRPAGRSGLPLRALGAIGGAAVMALAFSIPAAAADPTPGPQLKIAIDDGRDSAADGDRLNYTITVENLGTKPVRGLRVTQTIPAGMTFTAADSDGAATADLVEWRVGLKAGGTATMKTRMLVEAIPDDLLRLATVACAATTAAGPPIVCASHSDQLPAGVAAERMATAEAADVDEQSTPIWWYIAAGLAAIVVLAAGLVAYRRKPRSGS